MTIFDDLWPSGRPRQIARPFVFSQVRKSPGSRVGEQGAARSRIFFPLRRLLVIGLGVVRVPFDMDGNSLKL